MSLAEKKVKRTKPKYSRYQIKHRRVYEFGWDNPRSPIRIVFEEIA